MKTASLPQNGAGQAVRLPRESRFSGEQVEVKKIGNNLILYPIPDSWDSLFESLEQFSPDFMAEGRMQPARPNHQYQ